MLLLQSQMIIFFYMQDNATLRIENIQVQDSETLSYIRARWVNHTPQGLQED